MRSPPRSLDAACRAALLAYAYPGNVRELHNLVQHLSVVAARAAGFEHLPVQVTAPAPACSSACADPSAAPQAAGAPGEPLALRERVRAFERTIAEFGSKRKAARALGGDIGTIVRKTR